MQNTSNIIPIHRADAVTAIDHSLVPFIDRKNFKTSIEGDSNDRANGSVHSLSIPTTGKNGNSFHS
jgi:hypothetical protein